MPRCRGGVGAAQDRTGSERMCESVGQVCGTDVFHCIVGAFYSVCHYLQHELNASPKASECFFSVIILPPHVA